MSQSDVAGPYSSNVYTLSGDRFFVQKQGLNEDFVQVSIEIIYITPNKHIQPNRNHKLY